MSLTPAKTTTKLFRYGVITSKSFDDPAILMDLFAGHMDKVEHIYTSGTTDLVTQFAQQNGFPVTIYPLTGGRTLFWSTKKILENSDAVYVIADIGSKSLGTIKDVCETKKIPFKIINFDPITKWKQKVKKIVDICQTISSDEVEKSPALQSIIKTL